MMQVVRSPRTPDSKKREAGKSGTRARLPRQWCWFAALTFLFFPATLIKSFFALMIDVMALQLLQDDVKMTRIASPFA
jgi:hypothetical protein